MASAASASSYRLLGSYRLLLATLVFLQHALANIAPVSVDRALVSFEVGSIAVLNFFVLSGFIVTEAAVLFYRDRPVAFFANRLLRVIPSYLIALLITLGVAAVLVWFDATRAVSVHVDGVPEFSIKELLVNSFAVLPGGKFLLNQTDTIPVLVIAWALRIELTFYSVLFAAFAVAHWCRLKAEVLLYAAAIGALVVWVLATATNQMSTLQFVPFFVLGSATYYALDGKTKRGRVAAAGLASVAWLLCFVPILSHENGVLSSSASTSRFGATLVFLGLTAIWLLLLSVRTSSVSGAVVTWDKRLGDATYSLYLLHLAASMVTTALLPERGWAALAFGLFLSFAMALAAVQTYEAVIGRLRTRLRGREL